MGENGNSLSSGFGGPDRALAAGAGLGRALIPRRRVLNTHTSSPPCPPGESSRGLLDGGEEQSMGEKRIARGRTNGPWSGKLLTIGSTGFLAAVSLLMVLAPASGAAVHPTVLFKAPYKGTFSVPSGYTSWSGCAVAKTSTPKWSPGSGTISASMTAAGKTCKQFGNYGGGGSAYASDSLVVLVPFKVGSNGNHSVSSSWGLTMASTKTFTYGGCPAKNINYYPSLYQTSSSGCGDSANVYLDIYAGLTDLSNSSWYSYNGSYAYASNYSYYYNSTYCYNYGTPSCYNSSYAYNSSYTYGYNAPGWSSVSWNGATPFTFWNNGTAMKKTDKYALVISLYMSVGGSASMNHLLGPWLVTGGASLNMATLGNGAKINSINIV